MNRMFVSRLRYFLADQAPRGLRLLLAGGLLLISAALASVASERQLMLFFFLLVGVGLTSIFLRWPMLGLIVATLGGLIVPYVGPGGLNITAVLVVVLIGLWILDMVVRQRRVWLVRSQTLWPVLLFIVSALLSFGVGQLQWFTFVSRAPIDAQLGGLAIILLSAGAFLLVSNQAHDLAWLSRMTWAFLAFAAVFILVRSVLPEFGLSTRNWLQPAGSMFFVWLVAMAFSQATLNGDLHVGWRLALGGLVLVTIFVLAGLKFEDKSGWLPSLVSVVVIVGLRTRRFALLLVPGLILAAAYLVPELLASEDYSFSTRLDAWLIMAQIISVSPILGLGFANYYWYTPLFPIRGYAVSFNSHNNYVDIAAQTGIIGLACLLWLIWEVGRLGLRLTSHVPAGFARAYVYGALGGLAGTVVASMLGDWLLPFVYNVGLAGFRSSIVAWLFLGGLVSLERLYLAPGAGEQAK